MNSKRETAARIVVNCMCNGGFMNGWFGDIGEDFRRGQVMNLLELDSCERREWIERNRFNLVRYCRVPQRVLESLF